MRPNSGVYVDFIEYNHNGGTWWGNTTLVDEFIIPFTIELFNTQGQSQKVGIEEPRTKLFEAFKKETAEEFHSCVVGTDRIVSPCRADFGRGKKYENYFAKYIDEVWAKYAQKTVENGWTKEVVGTALSFTPPEGSKEKKEVCASKPKSTDAFLGEGVISNSAALQRRHQPARPGRTGILEGPDQVLPQGPLQPLRQVLPRPQRGPQVLRVLV